jgi:hypothetical protein
MNPEKSAKLKSLETQLKIKQGELDAANIELKVVNDKVKTLRNATSSLKGKITELTVVATPEELIFTEHSMLRYLERTKGINLAELQEEMLSQREIENALTLGTCKIKKQHFEIIIKDRKVITVK